MTEFRQQVKQGLAFGGDNNAPINFVTNLTGRSDDQVQLDDWRNHLREQMRLNWVDGPRAPLRATREGAALYELRFQRDQSLLHSHRIDETTIDASDSVDLSEVEEPAELYKHLNGSMLVVGGRGSGKSVLLWKLLGELLEDEHFQGLPVLLELHRWSVVDHGGPEPPPFHMFIRHELTATAVGLSPRAVERLDNELVLLLDGLDELSDDEAIRCLKSLGEYVRGVDGQPTRSVVLTCRAAVYDRIMLMRGSGTGAVTNAVRLVGLTDQEVRETLAADDPPLNNLAAAVTKRPVLAQMLTSPLWLSIARRVYQASLNNDPLQDIDPDADKDTLIKALYRRWVPLQIARSGDRPSSEDDLRNQIGFLAWNMRRQQQENLYLETVLSSWLPNPRYAKAIDRLATALIFGLIGGLAATVVIWLFDEISGPRQGLDVWLQFGMIFGIIGLVAAGVANERPVPASQYFDPRTLPSRSTRRTTLLTGGLFSLAVIVPSSILGLIFGEVSVRVLPSVLLFGLAIGLGVCLVLGLILWLGDCWKQRPAKPGRATNPYTALNDASRLGLLQMLIVGFTIAVTVPIAVELIDRVLLGNEKWGPTDWLIGGLLFGTLGGLLGGLVGGLSFWLNHWAVRVELRRRRWLPLRLGRFLETACLSGIMYTAGPGFRFRHRPLAEVLDDEWVDRQNRSDRQPRLTD